MVLVDFFKFMLGVIIRIPEDALILVGFFFKNYTELLLDLGYFVFLRVLSFLHELLKLFKLQVLLEVSFEIIFL